jgi:hypothetical protein
VEPPGVALRPPDGAGGAYPGFRPGAPPESVDNIKPIVSHSPPCHAGRYCVWRSALAVVGRGPVESAIGRPRLSGDRGAVPMTSLSVGLRALSIRHHGCPPVGHEDGSRCPAETRPTRQRNEANALLQLVRCWAQPPPTPSARHRPDRGRQACPASCDNPFRPSVVARATRGDVCLFGPLPGEMASGGLIRQRVSYSARSVPRRFPSPC